MKIPGLNSHIVRPVAVVTKNAHFIRFWATFSAIMYRIIPVLIFGLLFTQVAVLIDQHHYKNAPATDFLTYSDFNVQNARVGEDVYFKVCRQHTSTIRYSGNLSIYVIANPDQKTEQRIKVYGRNLAGTINDDCDNKVIRATDFKHTAGTYEMTFCVDFKVKYGYAKEVCKTSNRYRIYEQPADLQSQIESLELQLNNAQSQLKATKGNINAPTDQSLNVPVNNSTDSRQPTTAPQNTPSAGNTAPTGVSNGGTAGTGVQPPTCAISLGGVGLACGSDGVLRL